MFKKIFIRPFFPAMAAGSVMLFIIVGVADQFVMPWVAGKFTPTVRVPQILGVEKTQAGTNLAALGLILMLDSAGDLSVDVPKGAVMFQFPEAGAEVKKGRRIWARLSKGLKSLETPVLRGMSLRQAQISLEQSGLNLGRVRYLRSTTVPTGAVLGSDPPAGAVVMRGRNVDVDISLGSELMPARMPTLVGLTLSQAKAQLEALQLEMGEIRYGPAGKKPGHTVLSQHPLAGEPLKGVKIDLVVSE